MFTFNSTFSNSSILYQAENLSYCELIVIYIYRLILFVPYIQGSSMSMITEAEEDVPLNLVSPSYMYFAF